MSSYAAATRGIGVASVVRGRGSFAGRGRGAVFVGRGLSGPSAGAPSNNPVQFQGAFPGNESSAALGSSQDQQQNSGSFNVEQSDATTTASATSMAPPDTVEQSQQQPSPASTQSEEPILPRTLQDLMRPLPRPVTKTAKIISLNGRRTQPPGQQMALQRGNDEQQMSVQRSNDEQQAVQRSNDEQQLAMQRSNDEHQMAVQRSNYEQQASVQRSNDEQQTAMQPGGVTKQQISVMPSDSEVWGTPGDAWSDAPTNEGQQASSERVRPSREPIKSALQGTTGADAKGQEHLPAGTTSAEAAAHREWSAKFATSTTSLSGGGGFGSPAGFFGSTGLNNNGPHSAPSLSQDPSQSNEYRKFLVENAHGNSSRGQGQQPQFSSQPSFTGIGIDVSGSDAFDNSGFASGKPLEKAETKVAVAQAPPSVASDMVNRSFTSVATAGPGRFVSSFAAGRRPPISGSLMSIGQPQAESTPILSGSVVSVASAGVAASANDLPPAVPPTSVPTAEPSGQSVHNLSRSSVKPERARLSQLSALVDDVRPDDQPQSGQTASVAPQEAIPPPKSSDERGPSDHSVDRQLPERHETVSQVEMPTIPEAPARPPVAEGRPADFREMIHLLTQLHSALAEGVMEAVCLYDETNPAHFVLLPQLIELLQAAGLNTPGGAGPLVDDFGNIRVAAPPAAQRQENAQRPMAPRQPTPAQPTMPPTRNIPVQCVEAEPPVTQSAERNAPRGPTPIIVRAGMAERWPAPPCQVPMTRPAAPTQLGEPAPPVLQTASTNAPEGPTPIADGSRAPLETAPPRRLAASFRPPAPLRPLTPLRPVPSARPAAAQRQEPAAMAPQPVGPNAPERPTPIVDNNLVPREAGPPRQTAPPLRPVATARPAAAERQEPVQPQAAPLSSAKEFDQLGNELW